MSYVIFMVFLCNNHIVAYWTTVHSDNPNPFYVLI